METRFKTIRLEYQEKLKDQNHRLKFTQEDLADEFQKIGYTYINRLTINRIENNSPDAKVTKEILLAYHDFFGVTIDWLLGISESRYEKGDLSLASKAAGISEIAISRLQGFSQVEKAILNLLIENGSIHYVIAAVYDYYPNHFDKAEKAISDKVGYKFNRFLSMETLQKFLDFVHSDKRFFDIVFESQSKDFENKTIIATANILMETLSPEEYENYKKVGKKYGYLLPDYKKDGD